MTDQTLVNQLLGALQNNNNLALNIIQELIIERASQGNNDVVSMLQALMETKDTQFQSQIAWLLGQIATPASLYALIDIAENKQKSPQAEALKAIAKVGRRQKNKALMNEMDGILSKKLLTQKEPQQFAAIALGMASIGNASSVESLLNISEQGLPNPEMENALVYALLTVRNPEAVVPLEKKLRMDDQLTTHSAMIAGDALAAMGRVEATQVIMEWASTSNTPELSLQALMWINQVRDQDSLDLIADGLEKFDFKNQVLAKEIRNQVSIKQTEFSARKIDN